EAPRYGGRRIVVRVPGLIGGNGAGTAAGNRDRAPVGARGRADAGRIGREGDRVAGGAARGADREGGNPIGDIRQRIEADRLASRDHRVGAVRGRAVARLVQAGDRDRGTAHPGGHIGRGRGGSLGRTRGAVADVGVDQGTRLA